MKIDTISFVIALCIWVNPCTSISKITWIPSPNLLSTNDFIVPYWCPWTFANSKKAWLFLSSLNSFSDIKK